MMLVSGFVKYVPAVSILFCPALPGPYLTMFSKYSSRPSVLIEPLSLSICEMLADISFARIPFYPDLCIIYEERTDAGRPLFLSELLR